MDFGYGGKTTDFFCEILEQHISSSLKNPFTRCSKRLRSEAREDR